MYVHMYISVYWNGWIRFIAYVVSAHTMLVEFIINKDLLALKCTQGFWLSKIFELSKQSKVHTRQFGLPENEEKFLRWVR